MDAVISGQFNKDVAMGRRGWNGILFESLENRRLMAGDVAVHVSKGELFLTGDDAANAIVIERQPDHTTTFLITPTDGTTVNGSADPLVVEDVRGMLLNLGGGDDAITLDNIRLFGTVTIDGADGDDAILVRSSRITGDLTITGGAGVDTLAVRKSTIQRNLHLDGGLGKDRFHLWTLDVQSRLTLSDTSGVSLIEISKLTVDGPSYVRTGNSMDFVNIDVSTFHSTAVFTTKGQDDQVKVRGTVFFDEAPVLGGAGDNAVDRQVILSWDFRDAEQGWQPGFVDYTAYRLRRQPDGELKQIPEDEARYRFRSELRALPPETGVAGTGFYMSGINFSDDLMMYLTKELGSSQGLVAGASYSLEYKIKFASAVRSGFFGGVDYLKAGAADRKPQRLIIDGYYRSNYDKGNQARGGTEVSLVGNTTNGAGPSDPPGWRIVTRQPRHTHPVRTDATGNLWLIVGTEATFESGTTYYYAAISVSLTPLEAAPSNQIVSKSEKGHF